MKKAPIAAPITDIMRIEDVAEYLKCHPSTIYRMLKRGEIPAFRVGSDWRFRRGDIEQWMSGQELKVATGAASKRRPRGPRKND